MKNIVFITIFLILANLLQASEDLYQNEFWMQNLPNPIKEKRIETLLLPGTHDSAAYKVDFNHTIKSTDDLKAAHYMAKISGLVRKFIRNWTVTQSEDLYGQMKMGARYLDLRIAYNPDENDFYLTHTFTLITLDDALYQMKTFMDEHPEEVLVIDMSPDSSHRHLIDEVQGRLASRIKKALGSYLYTGYGSPTLKESVASNKRVFFYYKGRIGYQNGSFLNGHRIREFWTETSDVEERFSYIEQQFRNNLSSRYFKVVPITLTPQVNDVVKGVLKGFVPFLKNDNLEKMTKKIHEAYLPFFSKNKARFKSVSAVTTDFIYPEFIQSVIDFNLEN